MRERLVAIARVAFFRDGLLRLSEEISHMTFSIARPQKNQNIRAFFY